MPSDNIYPDIMLRKANYFSVSGELNRFSGTYDIIKTLDKQKSPAAFTAVFRRSIHLYEKHDIPNIGVLNEFFENSETIRLRIRAPYGSSMKEAMKKGYTLDSFFRIAVKLLETLQKIHKLGYCHYSLSSEYILMSSEPESLTLLNPGIGEPGYYLGNIGYSDSELSYISPELTGRLGSSVDYRADIYSAGMIFYELLTAVIPFRYNDPMETIYSHIARQPQQMDVFKMSSPIEYIRKNGIPEVLQKIVSKMISKNAEERYQNIQSIINDMQNCLEMFKKTGNIEDFQIAQDDFLTGLKISDTLYCRSTEIKLLHSLYSISDNSKTVVWISGESGIGKTALVNRFFLDIKGSTAVCIAGKFQSEKSKMPFEPFLMAAKELIYLLASSDEQTVVRWKAEMQKQFNDRWLLLKHFVAEADMIFSIDERNKLLEIQSKAAENQLNMPDLLLGMFRSAGSVFNRLVLFIDDIQWADEESFDLLKRIVADHFTMGLMFIGSFRTGKLPKNIRSDVNSDFNINSSQHIELKPLDLEGVRRFIADSINYQDSSLYSLAGLCMQKTGGNPFFLMRFLLEIHEKKLLVPQCQSGKAVSWKWDFEGINNLDISGNVLAVIEMTIEQLPEKSKKILQAGACIGFSFELTEAADTAGIDYDSAEAALKPAIQKHILTTVNEYFLQLVSNKYHLSYRFKHDRIYQAVISKIDDETKKHYHYKIGKKMSADFSLQIKGEELFRIISYLNSAIELLSKEKEILYLAELNCIAAKKLYENHSYKQAENYIKNSILLISGKPDPLDNPAKCFRNAPELTLKCYRMYMNLAYKLFDFNLAEQIAELILQHTDSISIMLDVYRVKINSLSACGKYNKAAREAEYILSRCNVDFNVKMTKKDINKIFKHTRILLAGKKPSEFLFFFEAEDRETKALMKVLAAVYVMCIAAFPHAAAVVVCAMLRQTFRRGLTAESSIAFLAWGAHLNKDAKEKKEGLDYAETALKINSKLFDENIHVLIQFLYAAYLSDRKPGHLQRISFLKENYALAVRNNNHDLAFQSLFIYILTKIETGTEYNALKDLAFDILVQLRGAKFRLFKEISEVLSEFLDELSGKSGSESWEKGIRKQKSVKRMPGYFYPFIKAKQCYLYMDYKKALEYFEEAKKHSEIISGTVLESDFSFLQALIYLSQYHRESETQQDYIAHKVKLILRSFRAKSKQAPDIYRHRQLIIEAVLESCISDNTKTINSKFESAIKASENSDYKLDYAITATAAYRHFSRVKQKESSDMYLKAAAETFNALKLYGLSKLLAEKCGYVPEFQQYSPGSFAGEIINTNLVQFNQLDLLSIIKATQAIFSDLKLEKVLENLMQVVVENAGAVRGIIILDHSGEMTVEAEYSIQRRQKTIFPKIRLPEYKTISHLIVRTVLDSRKPVIVNNAIKDKRFNADIYFTDSGVKSIMCVPLEDNGRIIGIIYLENHFTMHAFTTNRIKMLDLISRHIAVSVNNSIFLEKLRNYDYDNPVKFQDFSADFANEFEQSFNMLGAAVNVDSDNVMYKLDWETHRFDYICPELRSLSGLSEDEFNNLGLEGYSQLFHPEEQTAVMKTFSNIFESKKAAPEDIFNKRRLRLSDGNYLPLSEMITVIFDESNRPKNIVGTWKKLS